MHQYPGGICAQRQCSNPELRELDHVLGEPFRGVRRGGDIPASFECSRAPSFAHRCCRPMPAAATSPYISTRPPRRRTTPARIFSDGLPILTDRSAGDAPFRYRLRYRATRGPAPSPHARAGRHREPRLQLDAAMRSSERHASRGRAPPSITTGGPSYRPNPLNADRDHRSSGAVERA